MSNNLVKIGQGTYGKVYKSKDPQTNEMQAIKKVRIDNITEGIPCTVLREISLLKYLNHKNIIKIRDVKIRSNEIDIVLDYCKYDLKRYMKEKNMRLSTLEILSFSYQLIQAVDYIHSKNIIHRDIKPQNLLITEYKCLKLCDFGLARIMDVPDISLSLDVVTQWYRAPEILMKSENYGLESDMWSVGCVIFEMITGFPLFPFNNDRDQLHEMFRIFGTPTEEYWIGVHSLKGFPKKMKKMVGKGIKPLLYDCDTELCKLVENLMELNPSKRITAKQALKHSAFKTS